MLSAFSLVGYVLRMNISVAAPFMMTSLGLDKIQMGQVFSAFMIGYALFQVPWGMSGDRLGPGRTLTWAAVVWVATTVLTGFAPGHLVPVGAASLVILMVLRFLLGLGEAAAYPLASRAIASSMPTTARAASFSALIVGMAIGSAFTPPLVSWAMVTLGWRPSFYVCALLALALAVWWHRATRSGSDTLGAFRDPGGRNGDGAAAGLWSSLSVLKDRNIAWLSVSYFFDGYVLFVFVFWLFLYLVEERGFSIVGMAKVASSAYLVNALSALAAGYLIDRYLKRGGSANAGYKSVMAVAHVGSVACMLAMALGSPALAMASLFLYQVLCGSSSPGCYAMCQVLAGPRASGRWVGIQNSLGNLPGIIAPATTTTTITTASSILPHNALITAKRQLISLLPFAENARVRKWGRGRRGGV